MEGIKMIEELSKYLINEDKPSKDNDSQWYAGQQLEALKFYLSSKVTILLDCNEGGYQGSVSAILFVDDKFFLWRDSFGSCSGCDGLEGGNGFEYIKQTLTSVKEFNDLRDIINYLDSDEKDYLYGELKKEMIDKCKLVLESIGISEGSSCEFNTKELTSKLKRMIILDKLEGGKENSKQ